MPNPLPDAALYGTIQGLIQQIRRSPDLDRPVLLTEGDSWFSFPLHSNVIDHLRRFGQFSVLRLEKSGDELLRMLGDRPLRKLSGHLRRTYVRRFGRAYRAQALLLSGGGNDILAPHQLAVLLRSNATGNQPTDFIEVDRVRTTTMPQLKAAFENLCNVRDDHNPDCVIYTHGYDYAIPGDRPIRILWGLKEIGPWMHKVMNGSFDDQIFVPEEHRAGVARWLVDEFNTTLQSIDRDKFVVVDVRGRVDKWADEIHPRSTGFEEVARAFEAALKVQFPDHF